MNSDKKITSYNIDFIKEEVKNLFKTEQDVINFCNFLQQVQKFSTLNTDKRHLVLVELSYFKSQIQKLEYQVKAVLDKKNREQLKQSVMKLRSKGDKLTDTLISCYTEDNDTLDGLNTLYSIVKCWSEYMNDIYFMCAQTNKILGNIPNTF